MNEMNMHTIVNLNGGTGNGLKTQVDWAKYMPGRYIVFANINIRSIDRPDWAAETHQKLSKRCKERRQRS